MKQDDPEHNEMMQVRRSL